MTSPNKINNNSTTTAIVTDYDYLINLGYKENDVRRVLKLTNGDRNAAIYILEKEYYIHINDNKQSIKDQQFKEYSSWRKEMADDWIDNVGKYNQPNIAINRALHKTPIYLQIESYERDEKYNCNYLVDIILKDGRHWKMIRRYSDFCRLKESLPFGTCNKFSNTFPHYAIFRMSDEFVEKRILMLNEWIRELVLNEQCMMNDNILDNVYKFIQIDRYGGKVGLNSAIALKLNTSNRESFSKYDKEIHQRKIYFNNLRNLTSNYLPLSLETMHQILPFKLNINILPSTKHCNNTATNQMNMKLLTLPKFNMHQLTKDYSRDRLIIQGNRIQGSHLDLEMILKISKQTIVEILQQYTQNYKYSIPSSSLSEQMISTSSITNLSSNSNLIRKVNTDCMSMNTTTNNITTVRNSNVSKNPFDDDYIEDKNIDNTVSEDSLSTDYIVSTQHITPSQPTTQTLQSSCQEGCFSLDDISLYALHLASRTESAFTSYASLTQILDSLNTQNVSNFIPFLITPESDLANSLHINYSLIEQNQHHASIQSQPCWIECSIEGSTVYRIVDDIEMKPLLQLQVTYITSFICVPVTPSQVVTGLAGTGVTPSQVVTGLAGPGIDTNNTKVSSDTYFNIIEGAKYLAIEQNTTSTARDWDRDSFRHS